MDKVVRMERWKYLDSSLQLKLKKIQLIILNSPKKEHICSANKGEGANSKQLHFKSKLQRLQNMSDVGDYTDKSEYEE